MKLERVPPLRDAFLEYTNFGYSNRGADYSVTDLIKPPRIVQLFKRHRKEISKDLDILATLGSFRGNAIHDHFRKYLWRVIMKSGTEDYMVESRLWDRINGRKISGAIDCLYKDTLYDFKTTSVWKRIFGDHIEWEQQLNLYVFLLYLIEVPVSQIQIIAWYQDWNKMQLYNNPQYPKKEIEIIPIELWSLKQQHEYMFKRINIHKDAEQFPDDKLPYCSDEDMWAKADSWAVYKLTKQGKLTGKASRVLSSSGEAYEWIKKQKKKDVEWEVIHRPGERTRCKDWCNVNVFCNQWKEHCRDK